MFFPHKDALYDRKLDAMVWVDRHQNIGEPDQLAIGISRETLHHRSLLHLLVHLSLRLRPPDSLNGALCRILLNQCPRIWVRHEVGVADWQDGEDHALMVVGEG